MAAALDHLLDQFQQGRIDRRQLLTGLALATGGALGATLNKAEAQTGNALLPVRSLNHLHIEVSDHQKSADFYAALFGAKMRDKSSLLWTMTFPNSTSKSGSWISLQKAEAGKAGTYNHVGFGVDLPTANSTKEVAAEMNKRFPFAEAKATGPSTPDAKDNGRSIYFKDPDGLRIQVNAPNDDGWLPNTLK